MDWATLFVSLCILAGCVWQVRRLIRRTEEQAFVRGWDACALAEHARRQRKGTTEDPEA